MQSYEPLKHIPLEIQQHWLATLTRPEPTGFGAFRLVAIRPTKAKSFEEQRIVVLVLDENGFPLPNVPVAFAYSTAEQYFLTPDFLWTPPFPPRAFIVPTAGSGQIDQIQGSAVNPGQPGGITVYILEPEYASDSVAGAGMLGDHTGLHLTFQRKGAGVVSLAERLAAIEAWMANVDGRLAALEAK